MTEEFNYGDCVIYRGVFSRNGMVIGKSGDYYDLILEEGGTVSGYASDMEKVKVSYTERITWLLGIAQCYMRHDESCAARNGRQCNCGYENAMRVVGRELRKNKDDY